MNVSPPFSGSQAVLIQPPACVALTGAGGFVGAAVRQRLTEAGYRVRALTRAQSPPSPDQPPLAASSHPSVTWVQGQLLDDAAVDELLQGAAAVIHLVGIIREIPARRQTFERIHHQATVHLLQRAKRSGVQRFIHMSALGTRDGAVSDYHRSKFQGEQAVRGSGLAWTILRPSLIVGDEGEFTRMVRGFWCDRLPPFVPYFGKGLLGLRGCGRVQPMRVEDVAHCFVEALRRPATEGKTYELGGPEAMDWPTLYRRLAPRWPGRRSKPIVAIPSWLALLLTHLPFPGAGLPFTRDQVIMAGEDSVCDLEALQRDFEFDPQLV